MFQNYLMTAYRNIVRDPMFALINGLGLAVGFAACLMIFLFVWAETHHDAWVKDSDRVFRIESTYTVNGRGALPTTTVPAGIAPRVAKDFPEVEYAARMNRRQEAVRVGDRRFSNTINFADADMLKIFALDYIFGSADTALSDTLSIALSETAAIRYFGETNIQGRTVTVLIGGQTRDYQVRAVYRDLPAESHMLADSFALLDEELFEQILPGVMTNWFFPSTFTYVKLKDGARAEDMRARYADFSDRYNIVPPISTYANTKPHEYFMLHEINVKDIHLDTRVPFDMKPHGSMFIIYAFSGIAGLLLVIACINFINLSTARSLKRSKEVALRKTLGAKRTQLITQFMLETGLTVVIASLMAVGIAELALPYYNEMLNQSLTLSTVYNPVGLMVFLAFVVFVAVLSGSYPAFFVSRALPGEVLHSNQSSSDGSGLLRTSLVTLQFAVSIALVAATALLYQQTQYVTGLDMGYDQDNVAFFNLPQTPNSHADATAMKSELERLAGVEIVSLSNQTPANAPFATFGMFSDAHSATESLGTQFIATGYNFFETYGIKPIAGRTFSEEYGKDMLDVTGPGDTRHEGSIIVNESALKRAGYPDPEAAIGVNLRIAQPDGPVSQMEIVGVIPDVHFGDARLSTQPMMFYYLQYFIGTVNIKIRPGFQAEVQNQAEEIWRRIYPDAPFNLQFVEDVNAAQYDNDRRQGSLLAAFAILTIVVAGFGLYGLASFMAARRTKEVGIRKVMGASSSNIVLLFVWSMSKPILFANIIAWPLAWYVMGDWLSNFVYRIDITPIPFIFAGVLVSIFGMLTVAGRTLKVARTHPSKALRTE